MRWSYLVAVVANRGIALLCVLTLSYLLSGAEFGAYSLIAINALALSTLCGTWLATSATRMMAIHGADQRTALLGRIGRVSAAVIAGLLVFGLIAGTWFALTGRSALLSATIATVSWAILAVVYDVTLAAKNGLSADDSYMRLSVSRNIAATVCCVVPAWSGAAVSWIALGQVFGIAIALITSPSALRLIGDAIRDSLHLRYRSGPGTRAALLEMLGFGVTGTLAFGLLVLLNFFARNALAHQIGEEAAGAFALVSDLLFAPITLLATSFGLSRMATLYRLGVADPAERDPEHRRFLAAIGWVAMPYAVGGFIVGDELATMIMPTHLLYAALPMAPWSAVQSGLVTLLLAYTTLMLTAQRKRHVWQTAAVTLISGASAAWLGAARGDLASFALALALATAAALGFAMARTGWSTIPIGSWGRSGLAASAMAAAILALPRLDLAFEPVVHLGVGAVIYIIASAVLKPVKMLEILSPKAETAVRRN